MTKEDGDLFFGVFFSGPSFCKGEQKVDSPNPNAKEKRQKRKTKKKGEKKKELEKAKKRERERHLLKQTPRLTT